MEEYVLLKKGSKSIKRSKDDYEKNIAVWQHRGWSLNVPYL